MAATLNTPTMSKPATGTKAAATCGAVGGATVVGCCSVGVLGAVFTGLGAGTTFFALGSLTPVGDRPILLVGGLLLAALATWAFMRRRVAGLPQPVARAAMRRSLGVTVFSGMAAYFVVMQIVIPLLFLLIGDTVEMGMFFPQE